MTKPKQSEVERVARMTAPILADVLALLTSAEVAARQSELAERIAGWADGLVKAERERCAKVCYRIACKDRNVGEDAASGWDAYKIGAQHCAAAIRAGGSS